MTKSQLKKLVKQEVVRRINKGKTCFDPWIDYITEAIRTAAAETLAQRGKVTPRQELTIYAMAAEEIVGYFIEKTEWKHEESSDHRSN